MAKDIEHAPEAEIILINHFNSGKYFKHAMQEEIDEKLSQKEEFH